MWSAALWCVGLCDPLREKTLFLLMYNIAITIVQYYWYMCLMISLLLCIAEFMAPHGTICFIMLIIVVQGRAMTKSYVYVFNISMMNLTNHDPAVNDQFQCGRADGLTCKAPEHLTFGFTITSSPAKGTPDSFTDWSNDPAPQATNKQVICNCMLLQF